MKSKKNIPWILACICFAAVIVAAVILVPRWNRPEELPEVEQFGYAIEGQQMIQPREAEHHEDYEIAWKDPALEQIIRLYLNKAEGPVLHSDVWDIHAVYLRNQYRFFTDAESPDGYLPDEGGVSSEEPLPQLTTLEDFKHFDSLQLLELNGQQLASLSGLGNLPNFDTLNLTNCNIADLSPLADLERVNKLVLDENPLDSVELLAGMNSLTWLSLRGCGLQDISPLAGLSGLEWLDVSNTEQKEGSILDYEPIAGMSRLQYLGLANITDLRDVSFCSGLKMLETVDLENSGVDKLDAKQALQQVKTILI